MYSVQFPFTTFETVLILSKGNNEKHNYMTPQNNYIRYLNVTPADEQWGLTVTTAGYQRIPPNSIYPSHRQHPRTHSFDPQKGRVLMEYQLVYISEGNGFFESQSFKRQTIKGGTMFLLFPGEWHTYAPGENGWYEYWVGFKGNLIEGWIADKFFSRKKPVYEIGVNTTIIGLYEEIVSHAVEERVAYQQLISSIVFYLMGEIYYKEKNLSFKQPDAVEKINEARAIMKKNIDNPVSIQQIAQSLNVSYSWFRSTFKAYTGVSPAQYQLHLRYLRAKELLSTSGLSISEIAYRLNFETVSQFSTFFTKKENMSPSQFRKCSQQ